MSGEYSNPLPDIAELQPLWEQIGIADVEVSDNHAPGHASTANSKILLAYLEGEPSEELVKVVHRARRYACMLMGADFLEIQGPAYELFATTKGRSNTRYENEIEAKELLARSYPDAAKLLASMASELCVENVYPQPDVARAAVAITVLQVHELRKKQTAEEAKIVVADTEQDFFDMIIGGSSAYELNSLDIDAIQQEEEERLRTSRIERTDATHLDPTEWQELESQQDAPQKEPEYAEGAEETLKLIHQAEQLIALTDSTLMLTNNVIGRLGNVPVGNMAKIGHQAYRLACMLRGKDDTEYLSDLTNFHELHPIDNYYEYDRMARRLLNKDPLLSKKLDICLRLLKAQSPNEDEIAESIACIFLARINDFEESKKEVGEEADAVVHRAAEIAILEAWLTTGSDTSPETSDEA